MGSLSDVSVLPPNVTNVTNFTPLLPLSAVDLSPLFFLDIVNRTTSQYRVRPLPSNVFPVNATNGKNVTAVPGQAVVALNQTTAIGSLPIVAFIYLIMSLAIILLMTYPFARWTIDATVGRSLNGFGRSRQRARPLSEREVQQRLERYYPRHGGASLLASYAETIEPEYGSGGDVTAADLKACRELMRSKYKLDVEIWNLGDVNVEFRSVVDDLKRRSDATLDEIQRIVSRWRGPRYAADVPGPRWTQDEEKLVREIQERVQSIPRGQYGQQHGMMPGRIQ